MLRIISSSLPFPLPTKYYLFVCLLAQKKKKETKAQPRAQGTLVYKRHKIIHHTVPPAGWPLQVQQGIQHQVVQRGGTQG